ncbi:beta-N-acetylhexosaminidase [Vibrio viridaestus]|uniref:Beta-hexosaminidase n=1 Tax=Vibrio viridaestus TaxID=2487322 RepID=A0A3N9TGE8_9VIBR|nr:beta-N-acetylhexosaminidase [Vibrio viridaestus]RQW63070.1 beta-N-acetylhexosaminidase [Vibrio viridaestus]
MGPLWLDVASYEISAEEKEILQHPTVGGVILFARNYHGNAQLCALTTEIRKAAKRPILIGVDQEGGRVQRFRQGFTPIPAAKHYAMFGESEEIASQSGWTMAAELIAHDIDLSFAPVLDIGFECRAIGDRSFGEDISQAIRYSKAYLEGMKKAGMATTGKHFPGHGGVLEDSHKELPTDARDTIFEQDMKIFKSHIENQLLDAMMPAHVVYSHYDSQPASGSEYWLKTVLRKTLGFKGIVFSDDLSMEGAAVMGNVVERSHQALAAGCDMILVCNRPEAAIEVLDNLPILDVPSATHLLKKKRFTFDELQSSREWKEANSAILSLIEKSS